MIDRKAKVLQWVKKRPWPQHRRLFAESMAENGAGKDLLYFWFNLLNGNYRTAFDQRYIENRALMYKSKYPQFEGQINAWIAEQPKANQGDYFEELN